MSTIVKTKSEPSRQERAETSSPRDKSVGPRESDVEVPFTEYRNEKKMPFIAKYMGAESVWDDGDMSHELMQIENYMESLVKKGNLKNDITSVEKKLKALEKMADIDALESNANRINRLAAFVDYMRDLDRRVDGRTR